MEELRKLVSDFKISKDDILTDKLENTENKIKTLVENFNKLTEDLEEKDKNSADFRLLRFKMISIRLLAKSEGMDVPNIIGEKKLT